MKEESQDSLTNLTDYVIETVNYDGTLFFKHSTCGRYVSQRNPQGTLIDDVWNENGENTLDFFVSLAGDHDRECTSERQ